MSSHIARSPRLIDGVEYQGIAFIHAPKTGGTAISMTFEDILGPQGGGVDPHRNVEELGATEQFWRFSIARNPWERCVSWMFWHTGRGATTTLDEAIGIVEPLHRYGVDRVNFVLEYARLQEDVFILCDKLCIPRRALLLVNRSEHENYRRYFSDAQRARVAEKFGADIERFGYEFY